MIRYYVSSLVPHSAGRNEKLCCIPYVCLLLSCNNRIVAIRLAGFTGSFSHSQFYCFHKNTHGTTKIFQNLTLTRHSQHSMLHNCLFTYETYQLLHTFLSAVSVIPSFLTLYFSPNIFFRQSFFPRIFFYIFESSAVHVINFIFILQDIHSMCIYNIPIVKNNASYHDLIIYHAFITLRHYLQCFYFVHQQAVQYKYNINRSTHAAMSALVPCLVLHSIPCSVYM